MIEDGFALHKTKTFVNEWPERAVMDRIGIREVAVTSKEDRDTEHILRMDLKCKSVQESSNLLDIPEAKLLEILRMKRGK